MKDSANTKSSHDRRSDTTREQILDAAEELFAQKGYNGVSVRAITTAAKCNLAAVNYHFGNKENLYKEVFTRFLTELRDDKLSAINEAMSDKDVTLEKLLQAFCNNFIKTNEDKRFGKLHNLMHREELTPLLPRDLFFVEFRKPVLNKLTESLGKLCPHIDSANRFLCVDSIVSQLIHLCRITMISKRTDKPMKIIPDEINHKDFVQKITEHIIFFCKAGIEALNEKCKNNA